MSTTAEELSREQLAEQARNVNGAARQVFALVEDLLDWSHIQMEGVRFDPREVDLGALADDCIAVFRPMAAEKGISLSNGIADCRAWADPDMVMLVIRNLVNNAVKFTPRGGAVTLSAASIDGAVEVSVADTGVGMSDEIMEFAFDLDHKTSTTGTSGEKGTGLGLPLCAALIARNKGEIRVDSEVDKGSTITFTLPAAT